MFQMWTGRQPAAAAPGCPQSAWAWLAAVSDPEEVSCGPSTLRGQL